MLNILIVDDEPRYLRLLEANLRTEGYEVVTANDGQQAIDVFSSQPIDLVLLSGWLSGRHHLSLVDAIVDVTETGSSIRAPKR